MWKQTTSIAFGILSISLYYLFRSGESYLSLRRTFQDLRASYDFIIIGGGTSGSVLASRLSENAQINVLLIERGQEASRASYVPILAPLQGLFDPIWGYSSEPQKYSHFGYIDKISRITRGQSLGGCGHYNYHIISNETFKMCPPEIRERIRAKGSPYDILGDDSKITNDALGNAFLSEKTKYPGWKFETILQGLNEGRRFSNLDAYLRPAMNRPNLHVLIYSEVTKIDFKEKNPHSIHIFHHKDKQSYIMKGFKKLILAGGAINTPKLLLESGIGPKKTIESLNLSLVQDLPVGEQLQDHLTCPLYFHLQNDTGAVNLANLVSPRQIWQYLYHGKGIYSKSALSVQAIDPQEDTVILIYNVGAPHKDIYTKLSGMRPDTFDETFPSNTDPWKKGFILLAGCTKPRSIGKLHLHPNKSLSIDPNYLNDKLDMSCAMQALRSAVDIGSGESFKKLGARLHLPKYVECSNHDNPSFKNDDYVECVARTSCMTKYHPASTTPMNTVVERNFKVKNMENIFIVDGGVLPRGSFMYPNSVITDMAECASEMLLDNL